MCHLKTKFSSLFFQEKGDALKWHIQGELNKGNFYDSVITVERRSKEMVEVPKEWKWGYHS